MDFADRAPDSLEVDLENLMNDHTSPTPAMPIDEVAQAPDIAAPVSPSVEPAASSPSGAATSLPQENIPDAEVRVDAARVAGSPSSPAPPAAKRLRGANLWVA